MSEKDEIETECLVHSKTHGRMEHEGVDIRTHSSSKRIVPEHIHVSENYKLHHKR